MGLHYEVVAVPDASDNVLGFGRKDANRILEREATARGYETVNEYLERTGFSEAQAFLAGVHGIQPEEVDTVLAEYRSTQAALEAQAAQVVPLQRELRGERRRSRFLGVAAAVLVALSFYAGKPGTTAPQSSPAQTVPLGQYYDVAQDARSLECRTMCDYLALTSQQVAAVDINEEVKRNPWVLF